MRNIALLEWGPASLFHLKTRELIKVRTGWLEGGPVLPPFLSSMEEGGVDDSDSQVRYALSAYEDLNHAIRNLRQAFGFPYQEYVGYVNTLARKHRVRREHEVLLGILRRWAVGYNVDAVFWIDYPKANSPPGSFKMGPVMSRPFSAAHMQICSQVAAIGDASHHSDDESDVAWSEADHEHPAGPSTRQTSAQQGASDSHEHMSVTMGRNPIHRRGPASDLELKALGGFIVKDKTAKATPRTPRGEASPRTPRDEKSKLRSMIQEEWNPAPGSIYQRSSNPGPGYYSTPDFWQLCAEKGGGPGFGAKLPSQADKLAAMRKDMPDPGAYNPYPGIADTRANHPQFGVFLKGPKLVSPRDVPRKLPYISEAATRLESFGMHSGENTQVGVGPGAAILGVAASPRFSFGRERRPF